MSARPPSGAPVTPFQPPMSDRPSPSSMPAGPVLALDLGGTNMRVAVVTPDGVVHARRSASAPSGVEAGAVLAFCRELLDAALEDHLAAAGAPPVALGISAPGPLDPRSGVLIDPPNMHASFHGLPIAPLLADPFELPWALGKDTNVAILGEAVFGAGRGSADLVYLTISTGVGGAVISGGRLVTGPDGVGGELGHLTVDMDGPMCGCGARGHLESFASGTGMAAQAAAALADADADPSRASAMEHLAAIARERSPEPLRGKDVAHAAAMGDPTATAIVERARRAFAASVVSIVDVFGPDRVICGGGVAMAWGDGLLDPARRLVAGTAFRVQARRVRIVPAELGDDVGLIGTVPLVASALPASDPAPESGLATQRRAPPGSIPGPEGSVSASVTSGA